MVSVWGLTRAVYSVHTKPIASTAPHRSKPVTEKRHNYSRREAKLDHEELMSVITHKLNEH